MSQKVLFILQARMSSSRLPGKVLMPFSNIPSIGYQLGRLKEVETPHEIVVATSSHESDNVLAQNLESIGIRVYRGDLTNVFKRFTELLKEERDEPNHFVRLTADCPLVSPKLIDEGLKIFSRENLDYLSNTLRPHFPDGLDFEIVKTRKFLEINQANLTDYEKEHVTPYFYSKQDGVVLGNMIRDENLSGMRLTLDTLDDYQNISKFINQYHISEDSLIRKSLLDFFGPGQISLTNRNKITEKYFKEYSSSCEW